jgi:hypothetical protein
MFKFITKTKLNAQYLLLCKELHQLGEVSLESALQINNAVQDTVFVGDEPEALSTLKEIRKLIRLLITFEKYLKECKCTTKIITHLLHDCKTVFDKVERIEKYLNA